MVDDKEWCEGPFRQDMSVRKLFMTKNKHTRPVRRRLNGRENNPIDESSSTDEEDSCSSSTSSSLTSSSDDESTEDEKGSGEVNEEDHSSSSDDDEDGGENHRDGTGDTKESGESNETSDADSDETEDCEQQGSSGVVAPKFDLLPGQGYRGGKSRGEGLASLVRGATFEVMKDLSPKCEKKTPEELEVWRRSFRGKISPGIRGVDSEMLFEIQKKRARPIERQGKSIIKVDNGQEKYIKNVKGTPMPKKLGNRLVRFTNPSDELPVFDAGTVVRASKPCCPKPFCKFRPPSAKKRKMGDPLLMINDASGINNGAQSLHPLNYVGVDTCSARSVSSEVSDFLYVDRSERAKTSVELNGVGAGGPVILGRGPMLVSALDSEGRQTFMLDPAGVFVASGEDQARLRIYGQQRMKSFGFHDVQEFSTGKDYLNYRDLITIPLTTTAGILMVKTIPWNLDENQIKRINFLVDDVITKSLDHFCFQLEGEVAVGNTLPCLIMNVGKLSRLEYNRIYHWRHAHRSPIGIKYEERCHTCEASKHKSTYKRNSLFQGTTVSTNLPYWRLYSDAYGGQRSMGIESYEGGIGGFVFACPVSGTIKAKLYASLEQYPAVLYQVLQEIESEGYVTREIYCDTAAVNLSQAVEEVAEMLQSENYTYIRRHAARTCICGISGPYSRTDV